MLSTAKKKVKEEFSLADILATAATAPKETKGKSKVPVLSVSDDIKKKATRIREVKDELDSLETEYETLSAEMTQAVSPLREAFCIKHGYASSVRIPDSKGLSIGISWS